MTDKEPGYTNLDFEQSEAQLEQIAPDLVGPLRQYRQGVRNMMEGIFVPLLRQMLPILLEPQQKQIEQWHEDVLETFRALRREDYERNYEREERVDEALKAFAIIQDADKQTGERTLAAVKEVAANVGKQSEDIAALKERADAAQTLADDRWETEKEFQQQSTDDRARISAEVRDLRDEMRNYVSREEFEEYRAGNRRDEFDQLAGRLAEIEAMLKRLIGPLEYQVPQLSRPANDDQ